MGKREELEAKLIENPNDVDLRMVYADLLQSTGDPRGELIALSKSGANVDDYLAKHEEALLGPLVRFKKTFDHEQVDAFTWNLGFIKSAIVGYENYSAGDYDEDHDECTADKVVAALLQHPSALLLEELTVRMNMLDDGMYFSDVVGAIAKYGAPALRVLRLGEFQQAGPGGVDNGYDYENSWAGLGDASAMWKAIPRLEQLRIQMNLGGYSANGADMIGTFDMPRLKKLQIITGGLTAENARSFASGKLPEIEHLELWFGDDNYGGNATVADLEPLLATSYPKLSYLGLMNAGFTDDIVAALAPSKVLAKARVLDVSHGTMTDAGAQTIASHADAFRHLEKIVLDGNFISPAGLDAIRAVCKLEANELRDPDDDSRYVALSE